MVENLFVIRIAVLLEHAVHAYSDRNKFAKAIMANKARARNL